MVEDGGYAPPTLACRARIFLIKLIPHRNLSSFILYSVLKELSEASLAHERHPIKESLPCQAFNARFFEAFVR